MKLSHTLAALAFAAAVATALSAIAADAPIKSAATAPAGDHPDPGLVEKGKALYATHCIHCHGVNMVTPGTVAFDLRQFPHNDKARFVNSVTHGKNGRMPPWGDVLTPQEIDELWAYVLTGGKS
jgi:mono/diheme cytochrome c family protein